MDACKRPDIAERLLMALSPSDFTHEVAEIEEHLKECPACRQEMNALRRLEKFLGDNRNLARECLSPCPPVEALSAFAVGDSADPSVAHHLELCTDCREQVALIRELSQESLEWQKRTVSPGEKALIRNTLERQYGPDVGRSFQAAGRLESLPHREGRVWSKISSLTDWFHVPSLALGAAVAALLVVFLIPRAPEELRLIPVLSNAVWEKPSEGTKEFLAPKEMLSARKKVALVLLSSGSAPRSVHNADEMYNKIEIVKKLSTVYDFLSPKSVKDALAGREKADNPTGIASAVFEKTDANYVLTFEILPAKTGDVVKGTLFQRGLKRDLGSISQTGLTISRMPSKITTMAAELLLDAEGS